MRFVIACGGTGGHFYPGYALGKALLARGHEVLFLLRKDDPAGPRLAAEDLPFTELDLRGLPRGLNPELPGFFLKLGRAFLVSRRILEAYRPQAAVGMGGYLTFPLAAAARLAGVPVLLHESNAILGLANRLCRPLARTLASGLPLEGARLTGTPIREALWTSVEPAAARRELGLEPGPATLLVFGGSQGARALNLGVPDALARLGLPMQVLHLAGKADAPEAERLYREKGVKARVLPYLDAMHLAYAAADVVLCRSGAATLSELSACAKPAVLVPYPTAAAGHQELNAAVFERAGAARVLKEPLSPEPLAEALRPLLADASVRAAMTEAYGRLGLPSPRESVRLLADLAEEAARA